jgi:hypothetical protein
MMRYSPGYYLFGQGSSIMNHDDSASSRYLFRGQRAYRGVYTILSFFSADLCEAMIPGPEWESKYTAMLLAAIFFPLLTSIGTVFPPILARKSTSARFPDLQQHIPEPDYLISSRRT